MTLFYRWRKGDFESLSNFLLMELTSEKWLTGTDPGVGHQLGWLKPHTFHPDGTMAALRPRMQALGLEGMGLSAWCSFWN